MRRPYLTLALTTFVSATIAHAQSAPRFQNSGDVLVAAPNLNGILDSGFKPMANYKTMTDTPPGPNDDSTKLFDNGSIGVAQGKVWICTDATPGKAIWVAMFTLPAK